MSSGVVPCTARRRSSHSSAGVMTGSWSRSRWTSCTANAVTSGAFSSRWRTVAGGSAGPLSPRRSSANRSASWRAARPRTIASANRRRFSTRTTRERSVSQLGELAVEPGRQVVADLAQLFVHEMEVVDQPFRRGRDRSLFANRLRDHSMRVAQDTAVLENARQQSTALTRLAHDALGGRQALGVLFEALDTKELGPDRLFLKRRHQLQASDGRVALADTLTRRLLFQRPDGHETVMVPRLSELRFTTTAHKTPESSNRVIGLRGRAHPNALQTWPSLRTREQVQVERRGLQPCRLGRVIGLVSYRGVLPRLGGRDTGARRDSRRRQRRIGMSAAQGDRRDGRPRRHGHPLDHRVVAAAFPLPGGRLRAAIRLPWLGRCSIGAAPAPLMDRRGLTRDAGEQRAVAAPLQPVFDQNPEDDLQAHGQLERDHGLTG